MGSTAPSRTWDDASSPAATRLARRFEAAWQAAPRGHRPDPFAFLAAEPAATPADRLAVLRSDLNLRWEADGPLRVERYRAADPGLDGDTLVALAYEEFCLREDDGDAPVPAEYDERFPDLADRLRRVFDIHDLVGHAPSLGNGSLAAPAPGGGPPPAAFPEAGQTIAGFHLVEELGRGAFARVFQARERQLADRPVALKVARKGSREPQTLARLQHTHIVPVHSYRDDPATGLHLLCMPFFGRVTLERVLADPAARTAAAGADLLGILDRLEPGDAAALGGSATRAEFAALPFARAVAWWGARLADALAHAHDRGVLHRDLKPSNVLVTADGLPMLLDFNLAGSTWADHAPAGDGAETLGGTLAYMAPEHLDALAADDPGGVDARSDVFSLGVLLYEAVAGERPFPPPAPGSSVPDTLHRAAEARRRPAPRLRDDHPELPARLERVIRRCLHPDPAQRHPSAADLAADLHAVAAGAPLPSTREPWPVRVAQRFWRARRSLALALPLALALAALLSTATRARDDRDRVGGEVGRLLANARRAQLAGDYPAAIEWLNSAAEMTRDQPELAQRHREARVRLALARQGQDVVRRADALHAGVARLRPRFLAGSDADPGPEVAALLRPFRVAEDPAWSQSPDLDQLDPTRRDRLRRDVEEVLFLDAAARNPTDPAQARRALATADLALRSTATPAPWRALRDWYARSADAEARPTDPSAETSATAAYRWAVLRDRQGRRDEALAWLGRATWLDPDNGWYHHHMATLAARAGRSDLARAHHEAALAADPDVPDYRLARARWLRSIGERDAARADQDRADAAPR